MAEAEPALAQAAREERDGDRDLLGRAARSSSARMRVFSSRAGLAATAFEARRARRGAWNSFAHASDGTAPGPEIRVGKGSRED